MVRASDAAPIVAVVGDYMLDAYVEGDVSRVCPDAPAPVLDARSEVFACGGAANVAAGCSARGLEVVACGFTGIDAPSRALEQLLAESGVRLDGLIATRARSTLVKRRFCSEGHVLLRVDEGSTDPVDPRLLTKLEGVLSRTSVVLVSDYGYGSVTAEMRRLVADNRKRGGLLLVDAKSPDSFFDYSPDVVKPNYAQMLALVGDAPQSERPAHVFERADALLDLTGATWVIVTLDAEGSVVLGRDEGHYIPAPGRREGATSGAGDTFLVALAGALLSSSSVPDAARYATHAATQACSGNGTVSASVTADSVARLRDKKVEPERVSDWTQEMRAQGKTVVLTNGCFDIFHAGHADFLQRASEAGDALLVAVNTDESVRRLKGDSRPVNSLGDRLHVLESIGVVSAVTWFDDSNAEGVVARARPDVYVKGSDYKGLTFPESEYVRSYGGKVVFVDLLEGRSTTDIVRRVRSSDEVAV